jgi:hypothetical protein
VSLSWTIRRFGLGWASALAPRPVRERPATSCQRHHRTSLPPPLASWVERRQATSGVLLRVRSPTTGVIARGLAQRRGAADCVRAASESHCAPSKPLRRTPGAVSPVRGLGRERYGEPLASKSDWPVGVQIVSRTVQIGGRDTRFVVGMGGCWAGTPVARSGARAVPIAQAGAPLSMNVSSRYTRSKLLLASFLVLGLMGCYRVRSQLVPTTEGPQDTYRCAQLELGRAGYAIVGADRESGWLHAQKRVNGFFKVKRAEIYVTVIPDESGQGSQVQLTDNSYAEDDADRLHATCVTP